MNLSEGEAKQVILDFIYPVRSYIIIDDASFDPNTYYGGTWEKLDGGYALTTTNAENGGDTSTSSNSMTKNCIKIIKKFIKTYKFS